MASEEQEMTREAAINISWASTDHLAHICSSFPFSLFPVFPSPSFFPVSVFSFSFHWITTGNEWVERKFEWEKQRGESKRWKYPEQEVTSIPKQQQQTISLSGKSGPQRKEGEGREEEGWTRGRVDKLLFDVLNFKMFLNTYALGGRREKETKCFSMEIPSFLSSRRKVLLFLVLSPLGLLFLPQK